MHEIEFVSGLQRSIQNKRCVVTIGAFDGVHLGHQQLLAQLTEAAGTLGLPSVVIVFEPQPNEFFNRATAPARLMRLREKVLALSRFGVDQVLCLKFDRTLRGLSAEAFVTEVLVARLGVRKLIVGDDFRFGSDRCGDFAYLQKAGREHGFDVVDTSTHLSGNTRVSSTFIRCLLREGKLEKASELLGSPYTNIGRVIHGRRLGRKLGFPTMNVQLGRLRVPLNGVYAVTVELAGQSYIGVANVGVRPTVNEVSKPLLEVHLLDADVDAYGQFIAVTYRKKIRSEQQFDGIDQLKAQITIDANQARDYFASECTSD